MDAYGFKRCFKSSVFVGFTRWGCKHAPTISDGRQAREADKPLMPAGYAENEPTSPYSIAVRNTFIDTWACLEQLPGMNFSVAA